MTSAAVYLRLSKDDGRSGESNSIAAQRTECLTYAERHGWGVREFVDDGLSASKGLERPGYLAMLEAAKAGEVSVLLASKQDRYTRDRDDEFTSLKAAAALYALEVHTVEAGDLKLSTAMGALSSGLRAEFAAFEAALISARTKAGLESRRNAGEWVYRPCFGYRAGGVIDPDQAHEIRSAYGHLLDDGWSSRDLFNDWVARGVKTIRGGTWSNASRVIEVLRNPVLAGLVTYKGEVVSDRGRWAFDADGNPEPGPIVTRDEYERLGAVLEGRATRAKGYGGAPRRKYALAGLVVCGRCGGTMTVQQPGNGRAAYFYCDPARSVVSNSQASVGCKNRTHMPTLETWASTIAVALANYMPGEAMAATEWNGAQRLSEVEADIEATRAALAKGDLRASVALPVLNDLEGAAERLRGERAAHAAKVDESWHHAMIRTAGMADPDAHEFDSVLDNVLVLPEYAGFIFESRTGHRMRVHLLDLCSVGDCPSPKAHAKNGHGTPQSRQAKVYGSDFKPL